MKILFFILFLLYTMSLWGQHQAPAPLFRDPITDGAADPVLIWNRTEKNWWMLYTQRRANSETADVAYCYGNQIGIASSDDHGQSWVYRGTLDLDIEPGHNTFWAPDVVYHNGKYHMFVSYIQGVRNHWSGNACIAHYTSKNLWDWKYAGKPQINSNISDPTLYRTPDGTWKMWYKDQNRGSVTMMAESKNLKKWITHDQPAIGGNAHEGPKVFRFGNYYWMITDEWQGLRVYRSTDLNTWEKQGLLLDKPGKRFQDTPQGAHADVVVAGDKAYIFYFTHPGRKSHTETRNDESGNLPYQYRRSCIQVAPLTIQDGLLICDRNSDFDFYLPNEED